MQKNMDTHLQSSQDTKGAKQRGENWVNLFYSHLIVLHSFRTRAQKDH